MYVGLECPHCHTKMRTRKLVGPGDLIPCPRCGRSFHLVPDEESLVETFPIVHDGEMLMREERPIPRTRAWEIEETPIPRPNPAAIATASPPRRQKAGGPLPFQESRATVAGFLLIVAGGLLVLFLYWYTNTVRALDRTAAGASQRRSALAAKLASGKAGRPEGAAPKGAEKVDPDRTTAPAALQLGSVVIGISAAEIAPITVHGRETEAVYLRLTARVTNLSEQPLEFSGWHFAGKKATLRDASHNYYNHIKFRPSELPKGCVERAAIQQGETIQDLLVFETPTLPVSPFGQVAPSANLELDLQLGSWMYRFLIPGSLIRRPPPVMRPAPVVQAPPPPVPAQPQPQPPPNQPTTEELILADYQQRWGQALRVAKPKDRNRALEYLRAKKQEIITDLAKKYGVTRPDVKAIIPP